MKITDKMRLDFLEEKTAFVTMSSSGHYGVYPIGPDNPAEYGNTVREALNAAIKASRKGRRGSGK